MSKLRSTFGLAALLISGFVSSSALAQNFCDTPEFRGERVATSDMTLWYQKVGTVRLHLRNNCREVKVSYAMDNRSTTCQQGGWGCGFAVLKDFNSNQMLPYGFCSPAVGASFCESAWMPVQYPGQVVYGEVGIATPYGTATGFVALLDGL